jgi:hypothetical protein
MNCMRGHIQYKYVYIYPIYIDSIQLRRCGEEPTPGENLALTRACWKSVGGREFRYSTRRKLSFLTVKAILLKSYPPDTSK